MRVMNALKPINKSKQLSELGAFPYMAPDGY